MSELNDIFTNTLFQQGLLSKTPEKEDLLPFLRGRLRTKRLRKKFLKDVSKYKKIVVHAVWTEWEVKRFWRVGQVGAGYSLEVMNRESFASRLFTTTRKEDE